MHTVQKRTWEENDKIMFHISDEINGNLFFIGSREHTARMPGDRPKLTENVRPHSTTMCVKHRLTTQMIDSVPARHILFLRVLRPARVVLRPARLYSALYFFFFTKCNCCFCVFRQGCKNACKMLSDLCPCFHRSPTKLCPDLVLFMCWIATEFWSFAL